MNDLLITFLASVLVWVMFAGLIVLWIVDGKVKKEEALHAIFASVIAWIMTEMTKSLFDISRPFYENGLDTNTLTVPAGYSFPSSHTAIAFAIGVTIWLHNKKYGAIFLSFSILVGIGRVMANVHYPIDIIGGAVIGVAAAIVTEHIHLDNLVSLKRKKK